MAHNVYKTIEITGTSDGSIEEAVNNAVAKAGETVRHLRWFEVTETRGTIVDNQVALWQVTVKLGFTLED
jgi:flavin-binding protein dodecin